MLPDNLTLPLLWLGLLANAWLDLRAAAGRGTGRRGGYLVLWSIYWLFKLTTGKEGMGYGDFKLLGALGAGWAGKRSCRSSCSRPLVGAVVGIAL